MEQMSYMVIFRDKDEAFLSLHSNGQVARGCSLNLKGEQR